MEKLISLKIDADGATLKSENYLIRLEKDDLILFPDRQPKWLSIDFGVKGQDEHRVRAVTITPQTIHFANWYEEIIECDPEFIQPIFNHEYVEKKPKLVFTPEAKTCGPCKRQHP